MHSFPHVTLPHRCVHVGLPDLLVIEGDRVDTLPIVFEPHAILSNHLSEAYMMHVENKYATIFPPGEDNSRCS
jgi:hypothetical protein